jgi:hypothetical protein
MANAYVITSVTHMGDNATVVGTVNGVPVTVQCNWSAITQQPSTGAFEAFIGPLMLAQTQPVQPTSAPVYEVSWSA